MRELHKVIQCMINVIPSDHTSLLESLEDLRSSALYSSPELKGMWWQETAEVLYDCFGDDDLSGWQLEVVNIWQGKTE